VAGARDVKRRIKSVENTKQITRTMELVATSKLKRATDRVYATRPYSDVTCRTSCRRRMPRRILERLAGT
jgi:F0F1-type ATP synthase gamma subunit